MIAHVGVQVAGGMAEAINVAVQAFIAAALTIDWQPASLAPLLDR